jgi:pyruvate kinase
MLKLTAPRAWLNINLLRKRTKMKKTKIIATVGPACESPEKIEEFINAGVNVFRLNFSHGSHADHGRYIETIKEVRRKLKTHTAILADLQGPKIRVGQFEAELKKSQEVVLACDAAKEGEIPVQYAGLYKDVKKNDILLLDDGKIEMKVASVFGKKIKARVIIGGLLKPKKGINLPTGTIQAEVITSKDVADARFALKNGVDFLALSFVRSAADIKKLRKIITGSKNKTVHIVAKIERHEALADLDNIVAASDAVMVARGDLGIEVLPQDVPIAQKRIIRKCLAYGKPVIVATQMLESMIENPRSTRAETSDIANAILDGADAVMLSGETSVGKYPLNAVKAMKAIALNTEEWMVRDNVQIGRRIERDLTQVPEAVAQAANLLSRELSSKYIVAATSSGNNARSVSKYRPHCDIIGVTATNQVAGQISLCWGVYPVVMSYANNRDLTAKMNVWFKENKMAKKGDHITLVSGVSHGKIGGTNLVRVHTVE